MSAAKSGKGENSAAAADVRKICGLVMPISAMGAEYTEEHWRRVRRILERAIERAGLRSQLVWESAEIDVIQSRILQNIYENDVVICDVSGLNPNVMLETGLRLSTKKPTIIVTDKIHKPPFDIQDIGYIDYPRDLEYNATEDSIERIAQRIRDVVAAGDAYKSFVSNFRFETVTPSTIDVSSEQFIQERMDEMARVLRRIERVQDNLGGISNTSPQVRQQSSRTSLWVDFAKFNFHGTADEAAEIENEVDLLPDAVCHVKVIGENLYQLKVRRRVDATINTNELAKRISSIILQNPFGEAVEIE